jgi:hypothetical protein
MGPIFLNLDKETTMLKETIKYTDFNGVERTEDFYFNLNESELVEMATTAEGDLAENLRQMVASNDAARIMRTFKDLIARAYGEKTPDGHKFVKSPELSKGFFETNAYNKLFIRLVTDPEYAARFIAGIIPANLPEVKSN